MHAGAAADILPKKPYFWRKLPDIGELRSCSLTKIAFKVILNILISLQQVLHTERSVAEVW